MLYSQFIETALKTAYRLFEGRIRKGDDSPMFLHGLAVMLILAEDEQNRDDEEMLAAALLHDAIEDLPAGTAETLRGLYPLNPRVVDLVEDLTDPLGRQQSEAWKRTRYRERKQAYIDHLLAVEDLAVVRISCADKIHNLRGFNLGCQVHGLKYWEPFNAPPATHLWYFEKLQWVFGSRLGNESPLFVEYDRLYHQLRERLVACMEEE